MLRWPQVATLIDHEDRHWDFARWRLALSRAVAPEPRLLRRVGRGVGCSRAAQRGSADLGSHLGFPEWVVQTPREVRLMTESPLLHRRRLGAELRRLRADRTLDEVAEATLISTSKLSRLENGQGVPQPRDVRDLVFYYELDGQAAERLRRWAAAGRSQAWWREYSDSMSAGLDLYLNYESGASFIRSFATTTLPPLLQTAVYAEHLYRSTPPPGRSEDNIRRLVELRARQQELLLWPESSVRVMVVLDEAVLRRPFGSPADADRQLGYLRSCAVAQNVSIRVVPFSAGPHAGLQGPFTIMQFADDIDRDVVAVESHTGERFLEQPSSVLDYLRMFDAITVKALDEDHTEKFISEIQDEIRRGF